MEIFYDSYLAHHGIKGQRWGIRRFQNYDGTYTQRGLKRYSEALDSRNDAARKESAAKRAYKDGTGSKSAYKDAKRDFKNASVKEKKTYKNLKIDNLADQGKNLYKRGHTITGNLTMNTLGQAGVIIGSTAVSRIISSKTGSVKTARLAATAIGIGGTAVNAVIAGKTISDNRKLRAYYGH